MLLPPMNEPERASPWHLPAPPREGAPLFWRWMLGAAMLLLFRGMTGAVWAFELEEVWVSVGFVIALMLLASWQAWMLFRPGLRFAVWVALPILVIGCHPFLNENGWEVVTWWILALLLMGVRRRLWALWLASFATFLVTESSAFELRELRDNVMKGGMQMADEVLERIGLGGYGASNDLSDTFHAACTLLDYAVVVATLAFFMPPIASASGQDPIPQPVEPAEKRT